MELVQGISLTDLVLYCKKMSEEMSAYILLGLLEGMRHLHDNGIIHRDLKACNPRKFYEKQLACYDESAFLLSESMTIFSLCPYLSRLKLNFENFGLQFAGFLIVHLARQRLGRQ